MKPFQTLLLLAVLILIGGMAALYWGKTVEDATVPIEIVEEPVGEPTQNELSSGSYLVFQSVEVTDPGTEDWANDDTETYTFYRLALGEATYRSSPSPDDLVPFATIEHGPEFSGSLTSYIFGQNILMHRYETSSEGEEQDGVLSLQGEILDVRAESWGQLRSRNGRYEVVWDSSYNEDQADTTVTDLETGTVIATIPASTITDSNVRWQLEPFLIDEEGENLYIHEVCGCEATLSGIWQVELATGQVTRLDTLVNLDAWNLSDLSGSRLLALETQREASDEGPYDELLPPTTVRILDLDTLESTDLFVDEEQAWDRPWLDPNSGDRYVVRLWDEGNRLYLVHTDATEITEDQYLTDGWVLDWVGDWLVVQVQGYDSIPVKLINLETREEILIDLPERSSYVGSIELN